MRRRLELWIALALAAATVAAYLPLLGNEFVNYDDDLYITLNRSVRAGLAPESIRWAFTSFHGANWFPLTRLSWMLDAELFGIDARAFHGTSLLLHALNAVLLFLFFARATGAVWASAFVAASFAVHPYHVESVAWAAARKDVLSGFFFMLTLLAYRRSGLPGRSRTRSLAVFACLALGLMAKPTLVVVPFLLLALDFWPLRRTTRFRHLLLEKLPLFALAATFSAITFAAQRNWETVQSLELIPLGARIGNALVSGATYLVKSFHPTGFAVFYPYPRDALPLWQILGSGGLLVGVSVLVALSRRRLPPLAVGWFWFLVTLLPVIGLVQVGQAAMADRYTYLPLIGLAVALAWGVRELVARRRLARAATAALATAVLAALAVANSAQVRIWRDSFSLFEHALRVTEENHVAHINLATALFNQGRLDEAATHLTAALHIAPTSWLAHGILADVRVRQGRPIEAVPLYRKALRQNRGTERWHVGLGNAFTDLGRLKRAVESYREALRLKPTMAVAHGNLARTLVEKGEFDAAIASAEEALRLQPNLAEAHSTLGVALAAKGREERAIVHFERALSLRPGLAATHGHLGRALANRGELERALDHLDQAVRLEPEGAALHAMRGRLLLEAGRQVAAAVAFRQALQLGGREVIYLNDLAWLLATSEDVAVRDPGGALVLALEAAQITGRRNPEVLDTLAAAYAAAGRFEEAARSQERALVLAEEMGRGDLAAELRDRLARYRERRPVRDERSTRPR
jgi:Flp pilus assembly protein TadD